MENVRFVGLDVHVDSIVVAVAEPGGQEPKALETIPNDTLRLIKRLRRLGKVKCCYEAGPTGYGLQRALAAAGIDCVVVAPSLVPKRGGEQIKTDRRDAVRLARFLRSGDLTPIHVPDSATEAMRDLERARDDAKRSEISARHQLDKFLVRHGRRFTGKTKWTKQYIAWVRAQAFDHPAQQSVLDDYLKTVDFLSARIDALTKRIEELVKDWCLAPLVKALQAMRGIKLISAVTLAAEIGDFARFETAPRFMSYLGLTPSEHSSGEDRRRGAITRAGNAYVRRILVEAAWSYRYRARLSRAIQNRNKGVASELQSLAWRAQERLCSRFRKLTARGMNRNRVIVAVARELAGHVWAFARHPALATA